MKISFPLRALLFLSLFVAASEASAQPGELVLNPGKKFDRLEIGMKENEVKELMGDQFTESSYKEEMTAIWQFNQYLAVDSMLQFILGFDKCWETSKEQQALWPVYKLFFQNNKLNCFIVTSYNVGYGLTERVRIEKDLHFFDSPEAFRDKWGSAYLDLPYPGYIDRCYYGKGMELLFDEGALRTILVFAPEKDLHTKIAARSPDLRKEFAVIAREKGGTVKWPD